MCGYKGKTLFVTPNGSTQVADKDVPILKWDDPHLEDTKQCNRLIKLQTLFAVLAKMLPQSFENPGKAAPHKNGTYKPMTFWKKDAKGTSCTAFTPTVMGTCCGEQGKNISQRTWAFEAKNHPGWVEYEPGKLPSIGDIYLLEDEKKNRTRHVGILCHIDLDEAGRWVTADGGQNDPYTRGQCAELVPRPWKCSGNNIYLGGGTESPGRMTNPGRLQGWIDLQHPSIVFCNTAPSGLIAHNEADYQDFTTRIAAVLANP